MGFQKLYSFFRDWSLLISMLIGIGAYLVWHLFLPVSTSLMVHAAKTMGIVQPILLFAMLFLSFCKIDPMQIRFKRWYFYLALIQAGCFVLGTLVICLFDLQYSNIQIVIEIFMASMICPTATAAVVVTDKLGGNMLVIIAYTVIINVVTAIVVPACVPLANPGVGLNFISAFFKIMSKVFPLLVGPFLLAWFVRVAAPKLHAWIIRAKDLAFYIWMVSLSLAMVVSTRAFVHSPLPWQYLLICMVVSLVCCFGQFYLGKVIGERNGERISGGQALGQKNTVFIIWMAYTFMNPISSLAGGFYSLWHNGFNSWQLYRVNHGKKI